MTRITIGPASDPDLVSHSAVAWALDLVRAVGGASELTVTVSADAAADREGYALCCDAAGNRVTAISVFAGGPVGAAYALSDVAERLAAAGGGLSPFPSERGAPAVPVRGIARAFCNADHDPLWLHDRDFWTAYLDFLATQRFNRFHLAFGMQFNYGTIDRGEVDNYLAFAYPFLLDVAGFDVRAGGVSAEEKAVNLASLRHVAEQTVRRGMQFQLGLWTHAPAFPEPTGHRFPIFGLDSSNHAAYCAAALGRLLDEVPDIGGLTFRVHFEAGIPEAGQETFWEPILQAISNQGRPIEVDLHAKGVGPNLLAAVRKPNIRPALSAKYWAEHFGLPYHQTRIRDRETARPAPRGETMSSFASYSRLFTRYGYADYLSAETEEELIFRVWPGTQKLLLWGDPAIAAGYGREATFGGSRGVEYCEPLFFKGRKRGATPDRDPYARPDLQLGTSDWMKYALTYRLWGRLAYDPGADPEVWRRGLRAEYGSAAADVEKGLAVLSRILPLVSVVHGVGGANNLYWPEIYVDLPISARLKSDHYDKSYEWDDDGPQNWGRVSPFDPALFYGIDTYVGAAMSGQLDGRYTPLEVASWLEGLAATGERALSRVGEIADGGCAQLTRAKTDMAVLVRLGHFFAGKFRAAVAYAEHRLCDDRAAMDRCVSALAAAREDFAGIGRIVSGIYRDELDFGTEGSERGHWNDRLPAIDADLRALRQERDEARGTKDTLVHRSGRSDLSGMLHHLPRRFDRGRDLKISLDCHAGVDVTLVHLHYRHADQSKPFRAVEMTRCDGIYSAVIDRGYLDTSFPLVYFFELCRADEWPSLYPGLNATLSNRPYFAIMQTGVG